jgi:hypothetical protein
MRSIVATAAALAILGACGAGETHLGAKDVSRAQAQAGGPLYWLGESFDGLPLTHVQPGGSGPTLIYGECRGEGSGDSFHCTAPQVQLQHWQLSRRHPRMFMSTPSEPAPCGRGTAQSVPIAAFVTSGGIEVYAGHTVVVVFGEPRRAVRAAQALRDVGTRTVMPLPPPDVSQALERCTLDLLDALRGD